MSLGNRSADPPAAGIPLGWIIHEDRRERPQVGRAPRSSAVENDVRCRCAMHTVLPPARPAAFFMRGARKEFSFFRREMFRFALLRALVVGEKGVTRGKAQPAAVPGWQKTTRSTVFAEESPDCLAAKTALAGTVFRTAIAHKTGATEV